VPLRETGKCPAKAQSSQRKNAAFAESLFFQTACRDFQTGGRREFFMEENRARKTKDRKGEKGAAMVMVLLISFLLLIASAGILLETTMNTANVSDATADQQAYNAAESGIQSALNVLRGNVAPKPPFNSTPSDPANRIDYIKALNLSSSNLSTDASTDARLSRWGMNYATNNRVSIGNDAAKGYAYKISLIDPENNGTITFNTSSDTSGAYDSTAKKFHPSVDLGNGVLFSYTAVSPAPLDVSKDAKITDIGSFAITVPAGREATIPDTRFRIVVNLTAPYQSTSVVRGYIQATTINDTNTVTLKFDSPNFNLMGTPAALTTINQTDFTLPLTPNASAKKIDCSMTRLEPLKLLIRSTGYGPRGAVKQLEATVQRNYFDGLSAPAALTLVGSSSGFTFAGGDSAGVVYSGIDLAAIPSKVNLPSIGVSNSANLDYVLSNITKSALVPAPADITLDTPEWLSNTLNLDDAIQLLKKRAQTSNSYYASGVAPANFGNSNGTGITFCDGDCTFNGNSYGAGGGILVVTGQLIFKGDINFNGLIIVTGAGGLDRSGGGGGTLQGNTVIAPYDKTQLNNYRTQLAAYNASPIGKTMPTMPDFLAPKYDISGGGSSTLRYNSSSVDNGLNAVSNLVLGVVEK